MGVAEMRSKRMERMRKRKDNLAQAQANLAAHVADMENQQFVSRERRLKEQVAAARRRENLILFACAKLIQRIVRGRLTRAKLNTILEERAAAQAALALDRLRNKAASIIQKFVLRSLAWKLGRVIASAWLLRKCVGFPLCTFLCPAWGGVRTRRSLAHALTHARKLSTFFCFFMRLRSHSHRWPSRWRRNR
jgi:hypothetical protein